MLEGMIVPVWMKVILAVTLFFMGASVFSFLNVVIFRVPRGEEFVKTRSHCPGCGRVLTPLDLVPVVSYLCLGGKCRTCGSKIGIRDVLIEISGGCMCIFTFFWFFAGNAGSIAEGFAGEFYGRFLAGLTAFLFICVMTVINYISVDTKKIPVGTLIAAWIVAVIGIFTMPACEPVQRLIGFAIGCVPLLLAGLALKSKEALAGAAVLAAFGCMLGTKYMIAVCALAVLIGAVYGIFLLMTGDHRLDKRFRLMPVLYITLIITTWFGTQIADYFWI